MSSVPDTNSDRLIIDTVTNGSYEIFSVNLGISASSLSSLLLDSSQSSTSGTNWINYDLRSFVNDLGISDFSDTSFSLSFGTLGDSSITIIDAGDISSSQGFIQIDDSDVINFLLSTEIIPLCLRIMESGSELSKTVCVLFNA